MSALLFSNICLFLIDFRFNLRVWNRSFSKILFLSICFFLIADIAGVYLGIFTHNESRVLPISPFGKKLPVEELLFLHLLIYVTALLYKGIKKFEFTK